MLGKKLQILFCLKLIVFSLFNYIVGAKETWIYCIWWWGQLFFLISRFSSPFFWIWWFEYICVFYMKKGGWKGWNLIFHRYFPNEKRWMKRVKLDFSLVFSKWKKVDEKSETGFFIDIFQMKKGGWKGWNSIFHWYFHQRIP